MQFKIVYLILLLVNSILADLKAPKVLSVSMIEDGGLYIVWEPVPNNSTSNVLGYKIKMWDVQEDGDKMYKVVNGGLEPGLEKEDALKEVINQIIVPPRGPTLFRVEGADTNNISIDYVKPGVLKEIRISAFTSYMEGPMSTPWRVKILKEGDKKRIMAVEHTSTVAYIISVPTEIKPLGLTFPIVYNVLQQVGNFENNKLN